MTDDQCCLGFFVFVGGIIFLGYLVKQSRKKRDKRELEERHRQSALIEAKFQQHQRVLQAQREEYEKRHKHDPPDSAPESDDDYYPDYWGEDEDD